MKKLAIITTHPIQYNAPFFKMLTERKNIDVKVFYTWSQSEAGEKYDPGFGQKVKWDIPLLAGYEYCFVKNVSTAPGSHHFKGIDNPTLLSAIENWGADALLVYGWAFKSHFKALRYFYKKIPVFFRGDSTLLGEKQGLKPLLRKFFLRIVYSFVDIAFYVGIANKAYFKAMGLSENQLVFMPHAIDMDRFAINENSQRSAALVRKKLDITEESLVFLFAGKLDFNKNVETLLHAFLSIKTEDSYLLIVGTGNQASRLEVLSHNCQNVKFLNFQNQHDMPSLYTACDVFILPSKHETWGLSINEAMACGKAIIASDTCGASLDLIKENKNGFLFECTDKLRLSEALDYFVINKKVAKLMGAASLEIIQEYTYDKDCKALEEIMIKNNMIN